MASLFHCGELISSLKDSCNVFVKLYGGKWIKARVYEYGSKHFFIANGRNVSKKVEACANPDFYNLVNGETIFKG